MKKLLKWWNKNLHDFFFEEKPKIKVPKPKN